MEINITRNGFGNVGLEPLGTDYNASSKLQNVQASKPLNIQSATVDALKSSEPVAKVPDEALSRDDELGNLVKAAFNLPAPPMPTFAD